jgi:hypothetical protein
MEKNSPTVSRVPNNHSPILSKSEPRSEKASQLEQVDLLEVYVEKSRAIGLG